MDASHQTSASSSNTQPASSDSSHQAKSTAKKTAKLHKLIKEIESDIARLQDGRKKAKKAQQQINDDAKLRFLRAAAVVQRTVDENAEQLQQLRDESARDRPQVLELREKLSEQLQQHRSRRSAMERSRSERLQAIHEQITAMEAAAKHWGA